MRYMINNVPLGDYGFHAGWVGKPNEAYALTGAMNLPGRLAESYHDWGRSGIEPYVDADDIVFKARDFGLSVVAPCGSPEAFLDLLAGFLAAIGDSFRLNYYEVILKQAEVKTYHNGWGSASLSLSELNPMKISDLKVLPQATEPDLSGIDGYSWQQLGLVVEDMGNRHGLTQWQPLKITAQNHTHGSRQMRTITLKGTLRGSSRDDLAERAALLQALLGGEGIRTITCTDGMVIRSFCVDGFTISNILRFADNTHWGKFECKMVTL